MLNAKWLASLAMLTTGMLFQPLGCTLQQYAITGFLISLVGPFIVS